MDSTQNISDSYKCRDKKIKTAEAWRYCRSWQRVCRKTKRKTAIGQRAMEKRYSVRIGEENQTVIALVSLKMTEKLTLIDVGEGGCTEIDAVSGTVTERMTTVVKGKKAGC